MNESESVHVYNAPQVTIPSGKYIRELRGQERGESDPCVMLVWVACAAGFVALIGLLLLLRHLHLHPHAF